MTKKTQEVKVEPAQPTWIDPEQDWPAFKAAVKALRGNPQGYISYKLKVDVRVIKKAQLELAQEDKTERNAFTFAR